MTASPVRKPLPPLWRLHAVVIGLLFTLSVGYVVWIIQLTSTPVPGEFVTRGNVPPGGDFIAFRTAAVMAATGQAEDAYAIERFMDNLRPTTGGKAPLLSWAYPPSLYPLLLPYAYLTPWAGLVTWWVTCFAAAALAGALAARQRMGALWGGMYPAVGHAVSCGQAGPYLALPLGMLLRFVDERPFVAGIGLGLLALKPHFAVGPGLFMLAQRRWWVVAGAVTTVLSMAAVSLLFGGIDLWFAFLQGVRDQAQLALDGRLKFHRMVSAFALSRKLGFDNETSLMLHAAAAVTMLGIAWVLWTRNGPLWTRALGLCLAALCLSPYAYDYDLALLLVVAAPLAVSLGANPTRWAWAGLLPMVAVSMLGPGLYMVGQATKMSFGFPALVTLAVIGLIYSRVQPTGESDAAAGDQDRVLASA